MAFKLVGNQFIDTNAPEYQMYNTLGRDAGSTANNGGNIFTKRASSIGNAVGTTLSAPISLAHDIGENIATANLLKDTKTRMNDIAKKYGYKTWADWQDGYAAAKESGDTAKFNEMTKQLEEFKAQANANASEANAKAAGYEDYRQNNLISQNINQDRGKFLGSAINTLSTATDLLGLTNGPISNAIQGGIEGVADELEQNGLQNFDWNRAGQNALVGATTGAAVGAMNKGINASLAKKGGNYLKGSNAITQGLNTWNQTSGKGKLLSTLGTGVARGAQSGAVGGAVGAGLSSALNGGDLGQIASSALQGAGQGLGQGAFAGGVMAGANMAINKTPGVGKFMQKVNQATNDWENSGDNFKERWANTRTEDTWGNRFLDNRVADAQAIKQGFQNVGEGLGVLAERGANRFRSAIEPIMGGNNRLALAGTNGTQPASDTNLMMNETAARRVGDEIQLDGIPMRWNPDQESLTEYRDRLANELYKNHGAQDNIEVPGRDSKVGINAVSAGKMTSGAGPDVLAKRSELAGDNFDYLRYAEKVGNEPDYKGKHDFANDWDEYLTKNVRFSNGDVADVRNKIANDVNGKGNLYTADYDITKIGSPDKELGSGQSPYPVGASNTSTIPQTEQNVNTMPAKSNEFDYVFEDARGNRSRLPELRQTLNPDGNTVVANSDLIDSPVRGRMYDNMTDDQFVDYAKRNGWNLVESPETEVYRKLAGETAQPEVQAELGKTSKEYTYRQKRNEKLLDQYGTIDKPTAKAVRAVETVGQIADAGFEKPVEVEAAIKKITGSDGTLNKLNRKVIANAGDINTMDGVEQGTSLADFIDQQIRLNGLYGTNDGNALTTEIEAVMNKLPSRRNGSITGVDSAEDVFDVIQTLEKHSANYKGKSGTNYGTTNPYKDQKAAVIDSLSSMLKDRIYDASDISKVITTDVIDDMKSWYPDNKKWAAWVDENVATAKTGADLRAAQAPFVRMGKIIDNGIVNSGTFGSKVPRYMLRMATSNPLGVLVNGAEMVSETPIGKRIAAKAYGKLADREAAKTTTPTAPSYNPQTQSAPVTTETPTTSNYNPQTQVYNAIGRVEGEMANDRMRNASTLEDLVTPTESETSVYNSLYGNNGTNYQALELRDAMYRARAAGDNNAATELYNMYQSALGNGTTSTEQVKLTDKQRQANAAARALADLENTPNNFGYDVSDIPGLNLVNLMGNDYKAKAEALALQVGYMLSGATVNKEEAKNIGMAYVPQPRESETERKRKLQQLKGIIADYQQTYAE